MYLSSTWVTSPSAVGRGTCCTSEQHSRSEGCTNSITTSVWVQMRVPRLISSGSVILSESKVFGISVPAQRLEPASRPDHFISYSVTHQIGERLQSDLAHDVSPMSLGGSRADAQDASDLLISLAFRKQLQYFALARSQTVVFCCSSASFIFISA